LVAVFGIEFLEYWRCLFAWLAPFCAEVQQDYLVSSVSELLVFIRIPDALAESRFAYFLEFLSCRCVLVGSRVGLREACCAYSD
jgi:hypothetical protein